MYSHILNTYMCTLGTYIQVHNYHTHQWTHTHTHIPTNTRTHTLMHMCARTQTHTHTHAHTHAHTYKHTHTHWRTYADVRARTPTHPHDLTDKRTNRCARASEALVEEGLLVPDKPMEIPLVRSVGTCVRQGRWYHLTHVPCCLNCATAWSSSRELWGIVWTERCLKMASSAAHKFGGREGALLCQTLRKDWVSTNMCTHAVDFCVLTCVCMCAKC